MILNCIAVDDEPLALGLVSSFIEQTPFLKLIGRFSSAVEALKAIHAQKIDVVFLFGRNNCRCIFLIIASTNMNNCYSSVVHVSRLVWQNVPYQ